MKEIELSQGLFAKIDDRDYERVSTKKWHAIWGNSSKNYYAICNIHDENGKKTTISMHRFILNASKGDIIDHFDHDGLNNQRSNITIGTSSFNSRNKRIRSDNKSGFTGVVWDSFKKNWRANIKYKDKSIYLGNFEKKECAIEARKKANEKYGYSKNHGQCIVSKKSEIKTFRLYSTSTSGFRGVYFCRRINRWTSEIYIFKLKIVLGFFLSKENAIKARNMADSQKERRYYAEIV